MILQTKIDPIIGITFADHTWDRGNGLRDQSPQSEINVAFEQVLIHDATAAHAMRDILIRLEPVLQHVLLDAEARMHPCMDDRIAMEKLLKDINAIKVPDRTGVSPLLKLCLEAACYEDHAFRNDEPVDGADLVAWFSEWRSHLIHALGGHQ